jgi:hypothetical protein
VFQKEPCDAKDEVVEQMVDQLLAGSIAVLKRRYRLSAPLKFLQHR